MTACVNNENGIKGGVSHKVLRSVVAGVLAVSMVPTTALASEGEGAQLFAAGSTDSANSWSGVEFTWNVAADKWGDYSVQAGDPFYVTSAKDVFGDPVSASDYEVLYVYDGNADGKYDNTKDLAYTELPAKPGSYVAYLVEGGLPEAVTINNENGTAMTTTFNADGKGNDTSTALSTIITNMDTAGKVQSQDFKVTPLSLEGAFAYDSTADGVSDTSFKAGTTFTIAFADADGNKLTATDDYSISWIGTSGASTAPTEPGTYTAVLKGANAYAGSVEEVAVKIDAIDLEKDVFTVKPIVNESGLSGFFADSSMGSSDGNVLKNSMKVYVNGEELKTDIVTATAKSMVAKDGTVTKFESTTYASSVAKNSLGKINLEITGAGANFVDATAKGTASVLVVEKGVTFKYGKEALSDGDKIATFNASKGEGFDASKIAAYTGSDEVPCDVAVTKDGEAVESYDEPGVYDVVVTAEAPAGSYEYAGEGRYTFEVVSAHYENDPAVYAVLDGVDADGQQVEYDGEAVEPRIVAKDGKTVLTEGEDYTVTVEDAKGNAVESAVEPGVYTWTVDFADAVYGDGDTPVKPVTFDVEITKAALKTAKSDKAVYAYTGEAVTPVFTAYTKDGLSVEVDPSVTGVTYYEAVWTAFDANGDKVADPVADKDDVSYWKYVPGTKTYKASELKEVGKYFAEVFAPADSEHFTGSAISEMFEISKTANFTDVSSSDWFADPVYKAKELGYVNGIQGTTLFAPNSDIERSQIAAILFNMAGGQPDETAGVSYPTRFSDVVADAWYAKAVSWASEMGVVNGYAGTDLFGTFDKATREEVAGMFYNYAKAMGKDVSVADEDAALAKVKDADTVSPWFKTAVAWAVENGVMGNGGYVSAQDNITRAEVAAMAVNFQPEKLK